MNDELETYWELSVKAKRCIRKYLCESQDLGFKIGRIAIFNIEK